MGYPDFSQPLDAKNKPNLQYHAEGFHYTIGQRDPNRGNELAVWTKDNPNDHVEFSFLKLDHPIQGWDADVGDDPQNDSLRRG